MENQTALDSSLSSSVGSEGVHVAQFLPEPAGEVQIRKWRQGDVGPDGRVFWGKDKLSPTGERWVSADKFQGMLERKRRTRRAFYARHREKVLAYSKVRHAKVSTTPEFRASRKAYRDANAARLRRVEAAWRKRATAERPELRVLGTMRSRLKIAVRAYSKKGSTRAQDKEAVMFLLWLAARQGIDISTGREWHIDHVIPLSKLASLEHANRPENVRWLRAEENTARKDADASPEEVAAHLALVEEWKKETQSQKSE